MSPELCDVAARAERMTALLHALELCLDHAEIRFGPDLSDPTREARRALFGTLHAAQTYAAELRNSVGRLEAEIERSERAASRESAPEATLAAPCDE